MIGQMDGARAQQNGWAPGSYDVDVTEAGSDRMGTWRSGGLITGTGLTAPVTAGVRQATGK